MLGKMVYYYMLEVKGYSSCRPTHKHEGRYDTPQDAGESAGNCYAQCIVELCDRVEIAVTLAEQDRSGI